MCSHPSTTMISKIFDANFFCRRGGLSWCTILLFAVVLLKPNCFWTIVHCNSLLGGGGGSCCSHYFTIVFALIFVTVTILTQICIVFSPFHLPCVTLSVARPTLWATKKYFASIALPELILILSDMLTDFTNKIEHSFSVSVLTCM